MKREGGGKRYPRSWRKARIAFLAKHPSCVNIGQRGCKGTATCVDHIIDHHKNMELYWDRKNWQPMCQHCHSVKTANEQLRLPLEPRYDEYGIPTDPDHHWRVE